MNFFKAKKKKNYFILIAVVGLLIFLHYVKVLDPVEKFIFNATKPVAQSLYSLGSSFSSAYSRQIDKTDLSEEIASLRSENQELMVENSRLKSLEDENERLRQILKFSETNDYDYVIARVTARDFFIDEVEQSGSIIINKGLSDGVSVGLAIVNEKGIVVGKIIEVNDFSAKAVLITSGKCKLAATVQNVDRTIGVTTGELGLTIKMGLVPQSEKISVGDNVITSGLESGIPRGLLIGSITGVSNDNNDIWQTASIKPLFNQEDVVYVSVVK